MKQIKAFLLTLLLTQQAVWCGNCTSQPVILNHGLVELLEQAQQTGTLDLTYPTLTASNFDELVTFLIRIKNDLRIKTIDLSRNNLELLVDEQITILFGLLSEMPYVETLLMSQCHLAGMGPENLEQLAVLFRVMPNLINIDLSNNRLASKINILIQHLSDVSWPMTINLSGNMIGHMYPENFLTLFHTINRFSTIQFDLRNNLLLTLEDQTTQQLLLELNLQSHLQLE